MKDTHGYGAIVSDDEEVRKPLLPYSDGDEAERDSNPPKMAAILEISVCLAAFVGRVSIIYLQK